MADNYVSLKVTATDDAKPDLTDLKAKLEDLGRQVATARANVDDADADAKLLALQAKLDALDKRTASPKIDMAGASKALADIAAVDVAMRHLGDQSGTAGENAGRRYADGFVNYVKPPMSKGGLITGGVMAGLSALPAIGGVLGAGLGTALIGGAIAGVVATSPQLKAQFKTIGTAAEGMLQQAGKAITPALTAVLGQVPALLKTIEPQLAGIFKAVAPQIQGIFNGLKPIISGVLGLMKAAAPAFGPFIEALEKLVSSLFPGLIAITKAVVPVMGMFGKIMGTLGAQVGGLFSAMVPAVKAGMQVFSALMGAVGGLLPVIGKLAGVLAKALAPVLTAFGKALVALTPAILIIGKILGSLAGAILTSLAGALKGIAAILAGVGPAFGILAKVLGQVFSAMENTGVFGILEDLLENIAKPLGQMIGLLVAGLAPILGQIISAVMKVSNALLAGLSQALEELIPQLTPFIALLMKMITSVLPPLIPPITKLALALVKILLALMPLLPPMLQLQMLMIELMAKAAVPLAKIIAVVVTVLAAVVSIIAVVIGWVAKIIAKLIEWVTHFGNVQKAGNDLRDAIGRAFTAIGNAASRTVGDVVSFFKGLPHRIVAAVGDLGSLLWNAGKSVIQGLINGLKSMVPGPLRSAMGWAADEIKSFMPFSPAKKGPLSGSGAPINSGRSIARQIAQGLTGGLPDITSAMQRVTGGVTTGRLGAGGYGTAANGKLEVLLTFQGTLLKAMQAEVRNAGGDPQMFQKKVAYLVTFPSVPLDLRCEIDAGGWQDVSSLVYQREGTSPPVTLVRGRADESSQANPGSGTWEWNNRDGRFSPKNPVSPYYGLLGRNTPVRWSVPAQVNYLRMEADNASGASCPDSSGLHITGDIDIRIDLKLTSYAGSVLFAKWGASGEFGWLLQTNPDGTLKFFWSTTGSNFPSAQSTAPLPATGRQALRVTLAVSSGTVTFYTGPAGGADGSTWTQLGSAVVTGSTSVFATTAAIGVGDYASGTGGMYGSVYEFELRSGIAGTVKAHPVFSSQTAGATSFTDAESNTWTLTGTAEISDRDYRWHGQMSAQPPTWDVTGNDMAVKATAGGPLRLINQGNAPLMSPIKRAVTLLSGAAAPVAYWPMEDAAGATAFGSATGGQPMYFSGAPNLASNSDFACSNALPAVNSAAFSGAVSYSGTWTDNQVLFLLEIPSAAETDEAVISAVYTTGTVALLTLRYRTAGAGSLELFGFSSGGTQLFDSTAVTFPGGINGTQMLIAVALQNAGGGNITWHLDGWAAGAASPTGLSGSISGTVGAVTRVALNRDGTLTQTVLGHCAVLGAYQQLYSLFTATTPNGVPTGALNGWAGEPAATRFARLAGENGYAARIIGPPAASAAMGAQAIDTLANLLQACEDADRGQIFEPRQALALGYRTLASMYSQSPKLTLDYPSSEPGGADGNPDDSGLDPTYDDLLTRNDETLTRTAGSGSDGGTYQFQLNDGSPMSITGVGDYADTKSVNVQYDAQLPNVAGWMVHVGTVDQARWPLIPVNLARTEMAALYYDALDTDIGDHVQITNAPDLVVYDPVDQIAFQVTEQLGGFHYTMALNAVPELPYEVAIASSARADTAGSQLATSYSSSATSFSVDVTAGNLWITTSGFPSMFPFDINVAGERITVTAISGSSSPQTFTVTRAVNGVSKAQAADAPVALWNTPVAAL